MDSWGPPTKEHWSANRQFVLKVSWGLNKPDTIALYRRDTNNKMIPIWSRPYPQEGPPYSAHITNNGQNVILQDTHHNIGYGKVLVFLGPKGQELCSYELNELLTETQELYVPLTVSSKWWSSPGVFTFLDNQKTFGFLVGCGASSVFEVATGRKLPLSSLYKAALRHIAIEEVKTELRGNRKSYGLHSIAQYHLTELLPQVRSLLNASEEVGQAAMYALAKLVPLESVPLLRAKLQKPMPKENQEYYLNVLDGIDQDWPETPRKTALSPTLLALWHELSKNPQLKANPQIFTSLCEREKSPYLLQHSEFLQSGSKDLRYAYICGLVERGGVKAIPLLRRALNDSNDINRCWAFRGLVKYKASDLISISRAALKNPKCGYRDEALIALAAQGDSEGTARLKKELSQLDAFGGACKMIARQRRREFLPALQQCKKYLDKNPSLRQYLESHCISAMAACGDAIAQSQFQSCLTQGSMISRAAALEYVPYVRTPVTLAITRSALNDREPSVRAAARKALGMEP